MINISFFCLFPYLRNSLTIFPVFENMRQFPLWRTLHNIALTELFSIDLNDISTDILGDPEVTKNLYCIFAYLYWEGCVICSIYFRQLLDHPVTKQDWSSIYLTFLGARHVYKSLCQLVTLCTSEARTQLQVGTMLHLHTKNADLGRYRVKG